MVKLIGGETEGEGGEGTEGGKAAVSSRGIIGYEGAVAGRSTSKEESRLSGGRCDDEALLSISVELDSGSKAALRLRVNGLFFSGFDVFDSIF